jgi:hypothetical protein
MCVCVCVCAKESAQTARFNDPKVLSLLQTMSSTVCVCVCRPGISIKAQTAKFNMPTILRISSETMSCKFV